MQRSNVLLPEPLRPMRQTTSRGATSSEIFFSTCSRPKYLSRFEILTMGGISAFPFGEAGLDAALQVREHNGHDPIKDGSDDQCFHTAEVRAADFGGAPHQFVHKAGG